jgi:DNA-binding XRE family transcriptional regulator
MRSGNVPAQRFILIVKTKVHNPMPLSNMPYRGIYGFWNLKYTQDLMLLVKAETRAIKNFGKRLRHLRLERGLTQDQLADLLDKDRAYVSQLERGLKNVTLKTMVLIAECLEVEIAFGGSILFQAK